MLLQMFEARLATARHPPQRWNYPQGIALLASMGVHFTALPACSLAGEQISKPLDVLPGDFWWHRLTLRLGRRCGWWPFVWLSGCRWRVFLCPGIELTVDGPLDDAEQIPCGIADAVVATTRGPFVQHVLPQRGINLLQCHLGTRLLFRLQLRKALGPLQIVQCARLRSSTYFINTTTTYCTGLLRIPKRDVWRGFRPCFGIRSGAFAIPKKARSPFFGIVNGVFLWITIAGRKVLVGEAFGHHLQP